MRTDPEDAVAVVEAPRLSVPDASLSDMAAKGRWANRGTLYSAVWAGSSTRRPRTKAGWCAGPLNNRWLGPEVTAESSRSWASGAGHPSRPAPINVPAAPSTLGLELCVRP